MPTDPRTATGTCAALGVSSPWNGTFLSWQTGGADAGTIAATATAAIGVYPPAQISNVPADEMPFLPTYLPTATVNTLPPPSLTGTTKSISVGDGWFDSSDTTSAPTSIVGCTYPDAWDALTATVPLSLCGGGGGGGGGAASPSATTSPLTVVNPAISTTALATTTTTPSLTPATSTTGTALTTATSSSSTTIPISIATT